MYFDLIKLTEKGMYSSTVTMVFSISLFMSFETLTLDKPKYYYVEIKTLIYVISQMLIFIEMIN